MAIVKNIALYFLVPVCVLIMAFLVLIWYWEVTIQKPNLSIATATTFQVTADETPKTLAKDLFDHNLVRNELFFYLLIKSAKQGLTPGYYEIAADSSMTDIAKKLWPVRSRQ